MLIKYIFICVCIMSACGAAAAALILTADKLIGNRISYSARYYLGAAVLAALLIPAAVLFKPESASEKDVSLGRETVQQEAAVSDTEVTNQVGTADAAAAQNTAVTENSAAAEQNYENMRLEELFQKEENAIFPIRASKKELYKLAAALVWLAGALLLTLKGIAETVWFKVRILCFSYPAPKDKKAVLDEMRGQEGIRRHIGLRVFCGDMSPFITGIIFNTVYIPAGISDDDLRLILRHELVHCKRFDILYKGAAELAAAIHFFNPFVYALKRHINRYCELSCDERAIERMDFEEKRRYAMTMLSMVKKNRYRMYGAAALGERKTSLRERVEFIMKNKTYSRFNKVCSRAVVLAVLMMSTVFSAFVQAQNDAELPQVSYNSNYVYARMNNSQQLEWGGMTYSGFSLYYDTKTATASYSSLLGVTKLTAAWTAEPVSTIIKEEETIKSFPTWQEYDEYTSKQPYVEPVCTDAYTLELTKVNEIFYSSGKQYRSLLGEATITRNGEVVAENFPVTVEALPNTGQYKYQTYRTYITVEDLPIDGIKLDIGLDANFLDVTNDDRIEYQSVEYNFERSRHTKEVYLDKLVESRLPDGLIPTFAPEQSVLFNTKTQRAKFYAFASREGDMPDGSNDSSFGINLSPYDAAEVTDDSIHAEFTVGRMINGERIPAEYFRSVFADITVTGLSGGVGDFVEIKSADGTIYMKYQIGEKPKEKTRLVGTRDVSEFIVEGEDYFVGTPAEQEDFDRDEHDRYYKRIVVDDNGKVIFVIPIEDQMTAAVNDAAAHLNDPNDDGSYVQSMSYENMVRLKYDDDSNTYSVRTGVLIDPVTWWVRSVLRPENCYVDIDATEGIGRRHIDENGNYVYSA